jgi:hypothetical protein
MRSDADTRPDWGARRLILIYPELPPSWSRPPSGIWPPGLGVSNRVAGQANSVDCCTSQPLGLAGRHFPELFGSGIASVHSMSCVLSKTPLSESSSLGRAGRGSGSIENRKI